MWQRRALRLRRVHHGASESIFESNSDEAHFQEVATGGAWRAHLSRMAPQRETLVSYERRWMSLPSDQTLLCDSQGVLPGRGGAIYQF